MLTALPYTILAAAETQGWLFNAFTMIRKDVISMSSATSSLAMSIACLIVTFKMIKVAYTLMSDDKQSGFGGLELSQILRPIIIVILLNSSSIIISSFDTVVDTVTTEIYSRTMGNSVKDVFSRAVEIAGASIKATAGEATYEELEGLNKANAAVAATDMPWKAKLLSKWGIKMLQKKTIKKSAQTQAHQEVEAAGSGLSEEEKQKMEKEKRGSIEEMLKQANNAMKSSYEQLYSDSPYEISFTAGNFIPSLAFMLYDLTFQAINCFAQISLCLLAFFFPWVLVFSLMDPFKRSPIDFAARYVQVSFWKVICGAINYVVAAADSYILINGGDSPVPSLVLTIGISLGGLLAMFKCSDIAATIIPAGSGSFGDLGGAAGGLAQSAMKKVANMPGGAATGVKNIISKK